MRQGRRLTAALLICALGGCSSGPVRQAQPAPSLTPAAPAAASVQPAAAPSTQPETPVAVPAPSTAEAPIPAVLTPLEPPPPSDKPMNFWWERIPGVNAEVIYVRNNTGATMYYRNFELYECSGLKQPCGVDKKKVIMPPHATKAALVVRIVDLGGFSYKVRMNYGYQPAGKAKPSAP
jgi:hypothetical protein